MENQIANEAQSNPNSGSQIKPGVFTQTISTEQIKRIKWKTYFWSFSLPFWLIHIVVVLLFFLFTNTSFKINDKEINPFLFLPTLTLRAWVIIVAILVGWTIWPFIITHQIHHISPISPQTMNRRHVSCGRNPEKNIPSSLLLICFFMRSSVSIFTIP
jgi:hypothetical protein